MLSHPFIALHLAGIQASAGDLASLEQSRTVIAAKAPNEPTNSHSAWWMLSITLPVGGTPMPPSY